MTEKNLEGVAREMLDIIFATETTETEVRSAAITLVEIVAPDILEESGVMNDVFKYVCWEIARLKSKESWTELDDGRYRAMRDVRHKMPALWELE